MLIEMLGRGEATPPPFLSSDIFRSSPELSGVGTCDFCQEAVDFLLTVTDGLYEGCLEGRLDCLSECLLDFWLDCRLVGTLDGLSDG